MAPKPETMLSGSAELDFRFLSAAFLAGMHTCYPELQLGTNTTTPIALSLSCKTLPKHLGKAQISGEMQLRTPAAINSIRAALVLSLVFV